MAGGGISEPFIRRPAGTALMMLALLIIGIVAYCNLPITALPRIDFPTVNVYTELPGADPETMASSVVAPLERSLAHIAGITEMTSVSGYGDCSISLQFALNRDVDLAVRDVQAAINAARVDLPTTLAEAPHWRKSNPADAPIFVLALTSDTLTAGEIYDLAQNVLGQPISEINGVGEVHIAGSMQPAVRIRVNPSALASMGVSLDDVRSAIASANAHGPKGETSGSSNAYMIETNDQLHQARDYRPLIVKSANGAQVRLSAIAKVSDDTVDTREIAWFNTQRATLVYIFKDSTANVIATVEGIKKLLPRLQRWLPPAIDVSVLSDRTTTIRASVADVQFTLLLTLALVIGIVFVFLRRLWSTFAAASTVPLSIAGTFAGMYFCGYSLDNISLMAITIAVGFVIDDAIVMIENVTRRSEMGDEPLAAAATGARQIGFTVVSITVSLIAVFIPLLFMGGIIGRLFHEFAVTLTMAVAISAIISLTGTPMLCAHLMPRKTPGHSDAKRVLARLGEGGMRRVLALYARGLDVVLRFRKITFTFSLATIALTIYLYAVVPKGFFPQQDTGRLSGATEAPSDISFQAMAERQQEITRIILADPDVAALNSRVGVSGSTPVSNGKIYIDLKPVPERKRTIDQVKNDLIKATSKVQGIKLYLQPIQDIRVGGRYSKSQYQYTLSDINPIELNNFAPKLLEKMRSLKQIDGVTTDQAQGGLESRLVIDRDAASRLGVTPADIDAALYDAFGQRQISTIYTPLSQRKVVLEASSNLLESPASLEKVFVKSRAGGEVPLRAVAAYERSELPLSINHQGQFPAVTFSFGLAPGISLGEADELIDQTTRDLQPPPGLRYSFQGNAAAFQDSLSSEPWLIAMSIVAIYIILGVLYESLIHPLTIISTLPSAGIGALLALLACGNSLDVMGLIGIVLLIGIVKKNAILMIDFAIEAERERGLDPAVAIREACLLRFRPILMTTLAALFGALPLALGHGAGSELRRPLGIAIVGGLLMSQALTLFTTPVVYVVLDRLRGGASKHMRQDKDENQNRNWYAQQPAQ